MAKILIVDDSNVQKVIMTKYLKQMGHQIIKASDGMEGVYTALKKHPELILMDVVMPQWNGFRAIRYLKAHPYTKNVPIVIVSTKGLRVDKIWAKRQGAADYIVKPIDQEEFKTIIEKHLSQAVT